MPKEEHVYWWTEGPPYTPQPDKPADIPQYRTPIKELADLVEKILREADEKRERTHKLIAAFISSC